MKKISLIVSIVLILSLFSVAPTKGAGEFTNWDFQNGLTGWGRDQRANYNIAEVSEGENIFTKITCSVSAMSAGSVYTPKISGFLEGDEITASWDMKIDSLMRQGSMQLKFCFYNDSKYISELSKQVCQEVTNGWERMSRTVVMPKGTNAVSIWLGLFGGGEISLDNVSLTCKKEDNGITFMSGDQEISAILPGLKKVTARLRYTPENGENAILIYAYYKNNSGVPQLYKSDFYKIAGDTEILRYDTLSVDGVSTVSAFVWEMGDTITPLLGKSTIATDGTSKYDDGYNYILTDKMRGAYGGFGSLYDGKVEIMAELGCNALFLKIQNAGGGPDVQQDGSHPENIEKYLEDIDALVEENPQLNVYVIAEWVVNDYVKKQNPDYQKFKQGFLYEGQTEASEAARNQPCPVSKDNWEAILFARGQYAAQHESVKGFLIDLEMYTGYATNRIDSLFTGACFCDGCVEGFAKENGTDAANELKTVNSTDRYLFAKNNGIYEELYAWEGQQVEKIVTEIREKLQKINPKLQLGILPTYDVFPGVEKGMGTEKMPALVFNEDSYGGISNGRYLADEIQIKSGKIPAINLAGFWLTESTSGSISVSAMKENFLKAAEDYTGYWIYSINSFLTQTGDIEIAKNTLKELNQELDALY